MARLTDKNTVCLIRLLRFQLGDHFFDIRPNDPHSQLTVRSKNVARTEAGRPTFARRTCSAIPNGSVPGHLFNLFCSSNFSTESCDD